MKILVFLVFWVPGSCCLCKAQGNERRTITSKLASFLPSNDLLPATGNSEDTDGQYPPVPQTGEQQNFGTNMPTVSDFIPGMPVRSQLENRVNQTGKYQGMGVNRTQPVVKLGRICTTKLAFTGFLLLAGNLPYYIRSLRTPDKSGLKLTSQRSRIAAGNKGYKKVTSLTFAIPLARRY